MYFHRGLRGHRGIGRRATDAFLWRVAHWPDRSQCVRVHAPEGHQVHPRYTKTPPICRRRRHGHPEARMLESAVGHKGKAILDVTGWKLPNNALPNVYQIIIPIIFIDDQGAALWVFGDNIAQVFSCSEEKSNSGGSGGVIGIGGHACCAKAPEPASKHTRQNEGRAGALTDFRRLTTA